MKKLQVNDTVIVITGKDKGKTGRILHIRGDKVYVEGAKLVTRNIKKGMLGQGKAGTQVKVESAIHRSNVMLVCPECGKPTRVTIKTIDGKKVRVCKKCGKQIKKVAKAEKQSEKQQGKEAKPKKKQKELKKESKI